MSCKLLPDCLQASFNLNWVRFTSRLPPNLIQIVSCSLEDCLQIRVIQISAVLLKIASKISSKLNDILLKIGPQDNLIQLWSSSLEDCFPT